MNLPRKLIILYIAFTLCLGVSIQKVAKAGPETDPPITTIQILGALGSNGIYYGNVQAILNATDSSGVASTQYRLNTSDTWQPYSQQITLTAGKAYEIFYRSTDNNGNVEAPHSIKVIVKTDKQPPISDVTIAGTASTSGYYNGMVYVQIQATDTQSGIDHSEYSLDNGQNWTPYTSQVEVNKDGLTLFFFRSIDKAGNVEKTQKEKINLDLASPDMPTIVIESDWTNDSAAVELIDGDDEGSGSQKSQYRIGESGSWTDYTSPFQVNEKTVIYARTVDFAGNVSDITQAPANIDKVPPTLPDLYLDSEDWTNEDVAVFIEGGEDGDSLVEKYQYKVTCGPCTRLSWSRVRQANNV
jgi:hypothetical protein